MPSDRKKKGAKPLFGAAKAEAAKAKAEAAAKAGNSDDDNNLDEEDGLEELDTTADGSADEPSGSSGLPTSSKANGMSGKEAKAALVAEKLAAAAQVQAVTDSMKGAAVADNGRSCTGVLTSHPQSRDVHIDSFTLLFHGHDLLVDARLELNYGRWVKSPNVMTKANFETDVCNRNSSISHFQELQPFDMDML